MKLALSIVAALLWGSVLQSPTSATVDAGGIRLHYLEWGDRADAPMVLIHGIGRNAWTFEQIAGYFDDDYHVIAIDMRGHGDSDWAPDGAYTVEDYTEDLAHFVAALELDPVIVWGNSTGGRVAQMFAGRYPDRVRAAIIEDVGPERPRSIANRLAVQVEREDREGWASVDALIEELVGSNRRTERAVLEAWARHGSREREDGRVIWKRDPAIANDFVPLQHWNVVGSITAPIIYILGGASAIVPPETQRELERVLPQVEIATMPGLGHYPSQEEPEAFARIVDAFLAR